MTWAFPVLAMAALLFVVLLSRQITATRSTKSAAEWVLKARAPMNGTERKMFWRLQEAMPDQVILAQVALSQLIEKPASQGIWNKVDRKVLDFVICDADLRVLAVIETDGPHHRHAKQKRRDADKSAALKAAGYRLLRFRSEKLPTGSEIRAAVGISAPGLVNKPPSTDTASLPIAAAPSRSLPA